MFDEYSAFVRDGYLLSVRRAGAPHSLLPLRDGSVILEGSNTGGPPLPSGVGTISRWDHAANAPNRRCHGRDAVLVMTAMPAVPHFTELARLAKLDFTQAAGLPERCSRKPPARSPAVG